jgi:DNA-binding XRE family transcriptional regulator
VDRIVLTDQRRLVVNVDRSIFTGSIERVPAGRTKREESRFRERAAIMAAKLRSIRVDKGLTQEQLANRAQVAVSTLRKIESGRVVEPGLFTMLSIAAALGVSLRELDA